MDDCRRYDEYASTRRLAIVLVRRGSPRQRTRADRIAPANLGCAAFQGVRFRRSAAPGRRALYLMWNPPWVPHLLWAGVTPAPSGKDKRRCGTSSLLEVIAQKGLSSHPS